MVNGYELTVQGWSFRQWRECARSVGNDIRLLWRVAKDTIAPWRARLTAVNAAAYVVSPIQLIPSFIPVIGQLDDVLVLYLASKWIDQIGPPALLDGYLSRRELITEE